MSDGLVRASSTVTWVCDRDAAATARIARDPDEILADPAVRLVATGESGDIACDHYHATVTI